MLRISVILAVAGLIVGGAALAPGAGAQAQGLKRIPLQKVEVPPGEREAISAIAEVPPNTAIARHTHPGPEVGYVLEGELTLEIQGQPQRAMKAGDSFNIPANTAHGGHSGPDGLKVLSVYIVEKGKPLASPAK